MVNLDVGNKLKFAKNMQTLTMSLLQAARQWNGWSHVSRTRVLSLMGDLRRSKSLEDAARHVVTFVTPMVPDAFSQSMTGVAEDLGRPSTPLSGVKVSLGSLKESLGSEDSTLENNSVQVGFTSRLEIKNNSVMRGNVWNNMLARNVTVNQSDCNDNKISLAFLENLEIHEAKFAGNAFALCLFRKFQVKTADFTDNKLAQSTFNDVSVVESRLHRLKTASTHMASVRFESCDLQGLTLVGCRFENTVFRNVCIDGSKEKPIVGLHIENLVIADCRTVEDLLTAVKGQKAPESSESEAESAPSEPAAAPAPQWTATTPDAIREETKREASKAPSEASPKEGLEEGHQATPSRRHGGGGHGPRPQEGNRHEGGKNHHGEQRRRPHGPNRRPRPDAT